MYDTRHFTIEVSLPDGNIGRWGILASNKWQAIDKAYTLHDREYFGTEWAQRDRKKFTLARKNKLK